MSRATVRRIRVTLADGEAEFELEPGERVVRVEPLGIDVAVYVVNESPPLRHRAKPLMPREVP